MRKFLLTLAVLAGGAAAASGADAAPRAIPLAGPAVDAGTPAQPVQYYPDWREREWRRHRAWEHFRREEARREWHREHRFYGPRYGDGYGPRY